MMSETKKMTDEEIFEIFREEYDMIVRRYERKIEKYTLVMNRDYEYFFREYADNLYIAVANLKVIKTLSPAMYWNDLEKIREWFKGHIRDVELRLIEGSTYPTSSSIMVNTAEILTREAQKQLREDLQRLYSIISN